MVRSFEAARQDLGTYSATVIKRVDRVGKPYYWIGGERAQVDAREDSDLNVVKRRCVSITPVQLDFTAHHEIEAPETVVERRILGRGGRGRH